MTGNMAESPLSLQDLCLNYIASNIIVRPEEDADSKSADKNCAVLQHQFQLYDEVFIHNHVADALLARMSGYGTLCDSSLKLFNRSVCCLRHVHVDASSLTAPGLRVLRSHRILTASFNADSQKYVINDVLTCIGEWSVANLVSLSVTGGTFAEASGVAVVISLSKLRGLRALDVSRTDFNTHMLEIVVADLQLLESLDISFTQVSDLSPLTRCRDRLRRLVMYDLRVGGRVTVDVLRSLSALRYLDMSDDSASHSFLHSVKLDINQVLAEGSALNNLKSIDVSGHEDIDPETLRNFILTHKDLEFVGLCLTGMLCQLSSDFSSHHIQFTGQSTEELLMQSLSRYSARPLYMRRCLYELFSMTQFCSLPRPDLIKLILPVMRRHRKDIAIQTAVTACLYNLVQGDLAKQIHPRWLSEVTQLALDSMHGTPSQQQLIKNCLLLLCNDHILQEVMFDRYRCSKLVLDSLCKHDDATMTRMAVAICGILAAKITTDQTSKLGGDRRYMNKLLSIIDAKINARVVDITLKFTLSALWNLSDEAPSTCKAFVAEGGLKIFMRVLTTFRTEPDDQRASLEVKLLGFLNNLAEVKSLKQTIVEKELLLEIRALLKSTHTDVSYFAGGIIAHVLSDKSLTWPLDNPSRTEMLQELEEAVCHWQQPEQEMVAYRSFLPFFPLLADDGLPAVQMWAMWAWLHVCSLNGERYRALLKVEGGDVIALRLTNSSATHPKVAALAADVLHVISSEKVVK